eukprot:TRINITY_DN83062_c0_g1_i1.p1 TRINITY_DN83062_c0_g1~~TRINITY_DN83062_c0_g1_i1.p1  ORF type:complete len:266 (-),score=27.83 TRINITY_DN83062_c0_g1_i1:184-981(-)
MAKVVKSSVLDYNGKVLSANAKKDNGKNVWGRAAVFKLPSQSFQLKLRVPDGNLGAGGNTFEIGIVARHPGLKEGCVLDDKVESERFGLRFACYEGGCHSDGVFWQKTIQARRSGLADILSARDNFIKGAGTNGNNAFKYFDEVAMTYYAADGKLTLAIAGGSPFDVQWPKDMTPINPELAYYPYMKPGASTSIEVQCHGLDSSENTTDVSSRPKQPKKGARKPEQPAKKGPKPKQTARTSKVKQAPPRGSKSKQAMKRPASKRA